MSTDRTLARRSWPATGAGMSSSAAFAARARSSGSSPSSILVGSTGIAERLGSVRYHALPVGRIHALVGGRDGVSPARCTG